MDKKIIEELKQKHGKVYIGEITWTDEKGEMHTLEVAFKKPTAAEAEMFMDTAQKSVLTASQNLAMAVICHPSKQEIIEKTKDYPLILQRFVNELSPFFGAEAGVQIREA